MDRSPFEWAGKPQSGRKRCVARGCGDTASDWVQTARQAFTREVFPPLSATHASDAPDTLCANPMPPLQAIALTPGIEFGQHASKRDRLRATLQQTLSVDDSVDWDVLKDHTAFQRKSNPHQPEIPRIKPSAPPPPKVGFIQKILGQRKKLEGRYQTMLAEYARKTEEIEVSNAAAQAEWKAKRDAWEAEQADAIEEHTSIALEASEHDDVVP